MTRSAVQSRSRCVPEGLESSTAKLVCLYLDTRGETTLTELAEALELSRLTLFGVLQTLVERGHVQRNGDTVRPA